MGSEELDRMYHNPNIQFLVLITFAFKKAKLDGNISAKKAVAIAVGSVMSGNCPETRGMSMELLKNFSEGYRNAIKKYGEDIAAEKMERYLVNLIATKMGLEPDALENYMDKSLKIQELFTNGIHLTKDDNDEYHNE